MMLCLSSELELAGKSVNLLASCDEDFPSGKDWLILVSKKTVVVRKDKNRTENQNRWAGRVD